MKIEKVIKQLESILDHTRSMAASPDADGIWKEDSDALEFALTALHPVSREQVVQAWRGEWQYHPEDYDELTWTCSRCGEVWTLIDGTPDDNNMDFCPACGLPMTDKAVQMVMERLGALKDGKGD